MQLLEDQLHHHLAHDHLAQIKTHLIPQFCSFDPHFLMAEMSPTETKFQIAPAMRKIAC